MRVRWGRPQHRSWVATPRVATAANWRAPGRALPVFDLRGADSRRTRRARCLPRGPSVRSATCGHSVARSTRSSRRRRSAGAARNRAILYTGAWDASRGTLTSRHAHRDFPAAGLRPYGEKKGRIYSAAPPLKRVATMCSPNLQLHLRILETKFNPGESTRLNRFALTIPLDSRATRQWLCMSDPSPVRLSCCK